MSRTEEEWDEFAHKILRGEVDFAVLNEKWDACERAVEYISELDLKYNQQTNAMIERHAAQIEILKAEAAEWKRQAIYHNKKHGELQDEIRKSKAGELTEEEKKYTPVQIVEAIIKAVPLGDIASIKKGGSLPEVTRFEVIDHRKDVEPTRHSWRPCGKVELSLQDDCRTLKVFLE